MRWILPMALIALAGCSTHPIVQTRDFIFPGRLKKDEFPPMGGVCIPQGPVGLPPQPVVPITDLPPAPMPGGPSSPPMGTPPPAVVPPPVPLPPQSGTPNVPAVPPPPTFPG